MTPSPRELVRELSQGGTVPGTVVVPLALAPAARIQERDWDDFTQDATQLANGLRDLVDAVEPDGIPVTSARVLAEDAAGGLVGSAHVGAALEATRRLRQSMGDGLVLAALLPGVSTMVGVGTPEASALDQILDVGKEFLAAGIDLVVVDDEEPAAGMATLGNIARFHQAVALVTSPVPGGLPGVHRVPFDSPGPVDGIALTTEELARDTDLTDLRNWIDAVRG